MEIENLDLDPIPGQVTELHAPWPSDYGFAVQIQSEVVLSPRGWRRKYVCTWRDEQHRLMGFWHWGELVAHSER